MLAGAGGRYPRRWAGASPARAPRMPARPPRSQPLAAALARRRVCVRARSHCSISASRCAPPSPGPRSLAGSGPLPAPGGPGDGSLRPPSHPLPVPTLLALPHLLSFKDQRASQGACVFHDAWAAPRTVRPTCPCPRARRTGEGCGGQAAQAALAPWPLGTAETNPLFPQKPPIRGRHPN